MLNRLSRVPAVRLIFVSASRLGNGMFWYAWLVAFPLLYGGDAIRADAHLIVVGSICALAYACIKRSAARPRPYAVHPGITAYTPALDQYSFPSGHTMHATAFTIVALRYFPDMCWILVPFASLVALSRLVLGLHYPSDVIAGAALGAAIAGLSIHF